MGQRQGPAASIGIVAQQAGHHRAHVRHRRAARRHRRPRPCSSGSWVELPCWPPPAAVSPAARQSGPTQHHRRAHPRPPEGIGRPSRVGPDGSAIVRSLTAALRAEQSSEFRTRTGQGIGATRMARPCGDSLLVHGPIPGIRGVSCSIRAAVTPRPRVVGRPSGWPTTSCRSADGYELRRRCRTHAHTELEPRLPGPAWTMPRRHSPCEVPRVRNGTMVTGNTYRSPSGARANMAATTEATYSPWPQRRSGNRCGLAASNEHHGYGLELGRGRGSAPTEFEEACEVLTLAALTGPSGSELRRPLLPARRRGPGREPKPRPASGSRCMVGRWRRTSSADPAFTAARFADEWNVWGAPDDLRHKISVLERHVRLMSADETPPTRVQKSERCDVALIDRHTRTTGRSRSVGGLAHRGGLVGTFVDQLREIVADYVAAGVDELVVGPNSR